MFKFHSYAMAALAFSTVLCSKSQASEAPLIYSFCKEESTKDIDQVWQTMPSPEEAYRDHVDFSPEHVKKSIVCNQGMIGLLSGLSEKGSKKQKKNKIENQVLTVQLCLMSAEGFNSLPGFMVGREFYVSKLTLRNFNAWDSSSVTFTVDNHLGGQSVWLSGYDPLAKKKKVKDSSSEDVYDAYLNHMGIAEKKKSDLLPLTPFDRVRCAYRNIVSSEFSLSPQLAGPMGYHEYIFDGGKISRKGWQYIVSIDQNAPTKIVIENCQGCWSVKGITQEEMNRIFTWQDRAETHNSSGKILDHGFNLNLIK